MTEYSIVDDGTLGTGSRRFAVRVDGKTVATGRSKIEAIVKLLSELDADIPAHLIDELENALRKGLPS